MRLRLDQAKHGAGSSGTKKGDIEVVRDLYAPCWQFNELGVFEPTGEQQAQYDAMLVTVLSTFSVAVGSLVNPQNGPMAGWHY